MALVFDLKLSNTKRPHNLDNDAEDPIVGA